MSVCFFLVFVHVTVFSFSPEDALAFVVLAAFVDDDSPICFFIFADEQPTISAATAIVASIRFMLLILPLRSC